MLAGIEAEVLDNFGGEDRLGDCRLVVGGVAALPRVSLLIQW